MRKIEVVDDGNIVIHVPLASRKCQGRKSIVLPVDAHNEKLNVENADNRSIAAIARANKWQQLIDKGVVTSVNDIADKVNLNQSFVSKILKLNYISPKIIREILNQTPKGCNISLARLRKITTPIWEEQEKELGIS